MTFLKFTYSKIFFAAAIFAVAIFFFTPIKVNAYCIQAENCPVFTQFVKITEITTVPNYVNIHYLLAIVELILSYILASIILAISGRGGALNFIEKIS